MPRGIRIRPRRVNRRLLIVLPTFDGGGAERFNLELADSLGREGWQCTIFCLNRRGPLFREAEERGVPVAAGAGYSGTATWMLALSVLVGLPRLARAMRRADVTIAGMEGMATIVASLLGRLFGVPVIAEVQVDLDAKFARRGVVWRLLGLASRLCYPLCGRVVAISDGAAASMARIGVQIPISVIPMAINSERVEELAGRHGVAGSVPTILAVGQMRPQKAFDVLLRAHARARTAVAHRLLIIGDGAQRPDLEALIAGLGVADTVDMPGFDPNPFRAMRSASALCLSSRYEGMPTVILEALSLGCPVIATDCSQGVRAALANGARGALVPVGDPDALAEALVRHLEDPATLEAKAKAAAPVVKEAHSYHGAASGYLELIRELVAEHGRAAQVDDADEGA